MLSHCSIRNLLIATALVIPGISYAEIGLCIPVTDTSFKVSVSPSNSQCFQLPKHTIEVGCIVTQLGGSNKAKLASTTSEYKLQVTQHYYGPDMPGAVTFTETIREENQPFGFSGTQSPDTMNLQFEYVSPTQPSSDDSISLLCSFTTGK